MKLYHGSNIEIDTVDFEKCRPNKDFGKGFYLTTFKEQVQNMLKSDALKEYVTQDLVAYLVQDRGIEIVDAMTLIYDSKVFELLQDAETGLYAEGSAYVYDLLKNELSNGKLVQQEI